MTYLYKFGNDSINAHAFNHDLSQLALSVNSNNFFIFSCPAILTSPYSSAANGENGQITNGKGELDSTEPPCYNKKFRLLHILRQHTAPVTSLDWSRGSGGLDDATSVGGGDSTTDRHGKIVSCSADRNAYVWQKEVSSSGGEEWRPLLVILQTNRSATCVRWSPFGNKFAVGSAAALVAVCYYERENNWWPSKRVKKPIRSCVTAVAWHPNNQLLACASMDFCTRVYSAHLKTEETAALRTGWGGKTAFNALLYESPPDYGAWVNCVEFSACGNRLAWVTQSASVFVAVVASVDDSHPLPPAKRGGGTAGDSTADVTLFHVDTAFLPFRSILWAAPHTLIAGGFDCEPFVVTFNPSASSSAKVFQFVSMDSGREISSTGEKKVTARDFFRDKDNKAAHSNEMTPFQIIEKSSVNLRTLHQNTINEFRATVRDGDRVEQISSVARDGCVVIWQLATLSQRIANLHIK